MKTSGSRWLRSAFEAAVLLLLGGAAGATDLSTGLALREDVVDNVDCCIANVSNVAFTVDDILICSTEGCAWENSALARGLTPRTVDGTRGFCVDLPGQDECEKWKLRGCVQPRVQYRCQFEIREDVPAESVRGTLRVREMILDAHPMPKLPACGSAAAPQCDGSCPFGSGECRFSESSNTCFCGID